MKYLKFVELVEKTFEYRDNKDYEILDMHFDDGHTYFFSDILFTGHLLFKDDIEKLHVQNMSKHANGILLHVVMSLTNYNNL